MTIESTGLLAGETVARQRGGIRLNNIAELRLLFAACVVVSHAVQLAQAQSLDALRVIMNSEVAVQGFFILSGYLVFGSFDRLRDAWSFYRRRLARIYPAYAFAVLFFLALILLQAALLDQDFSWGDVGGYLVVNLLTLNFLHPSIDGIFAANAEQAINGALWSIKVEMMFYAVVPLLYAVATRRSIVAVIVALVLIGALWWPALGLAGSLAQLPVPESLRNQLPGQLHYFGLGLALFAYSRDRLGPATLVAIVAGSVALVAAAADLRSALHVLGLVSVIGFVARAPAINSIFSQTDISYGIYLCHFPIIQMLLAGGAAQWPMLLYFGLVATVVVLYGIASWRLIESPALELNRRLKP